MEQCERPDKIVSIMSQYNEAREKQRERERYGQSKTICGDTRVIKNRLSRKQVDLIQKEFTKIKGKRYSQILE